MRGVYDPLERVQHTHIRQKLFCKRSAAAVVEEKGEQSAAILERKPLEIFVVRVYKLEALIVGVCHVASVLSFLLCDII